MTENTALVSIIINCYNSEKYLKEAIDSVYSQTFQNWEIIFWDNASEDNSPAIAKSYDSRLKYFRSEKTTLLGEARVQACKQAKGKYLAFLDCDDLWLKNKLEHQVQLFSDSDQNLGLIYGRAEILSTKMKGNNFYPNIDHPLYEGNIFHQLCHSNFIPFVSTIVDKEKYDDCGGFSKHLRHATDYVLFLKMAKKYNVKAMEGIHCKYRMHDSNLSNFLQVVAAKEAIQVVESFLPDKSAESGLRYWNCELAIAHLKKHAYFQAMYLLFKFNLWGVLCNRIFKIN